MTQDCMNPKTMARIGQILLEESIMAVLTQAQRNKDGYLRNSQISERAGIYTCSKYYSGMCELITNGMMDKLESEGKVKKYRLGNYKVWALSEAPVN